MRRLLGVLVSMRTTAALLVVLAALMLLTVLLPQDSGATRDTYLRAVERSAVARFWLETAGLGRIATSAPFVVTLVAFFASLAAVLVDRTSSTLRRLRVRAPTREQLAAMVAQEGALEIPLPPGFAGAEAARALESLGYRTAVAGEGSLFAVRNASAVLGFPLFHLAFFVLCAGGVQIWATRSVAMVLATEGQAFGARDVRPVRRAPFERPPAFELQVDRVDVALEDGKPIDLSAVLRPSQPSEPVQVARVNHPAEWGNLSVLVERAGLAPVLWLQDSRGFTIDRVAVVTSNEAEAATARLGPSGVVVSVDPIPSGSTFPERRALARTPLRVRVHERDRLVFDGPLTAGAVVPVGDRFLQIAEVRYWVILRLVFERGGALLVAGFVLAVVGLVWRMLLYRREVAVIWDDRTVRIAGRAEMFPAGFPSELETIRDVLGGGRGRKDARAQGGDA
jgi:hypothetical protein